MNLTLREIIDTANKRVENELGFSWLSNARSNVDTIRKHKKVRNLEFEPNKIALVCGAGPSLSDEKHIEFIKKYRDRFAIFAVDVAFPVLYKHEIYPDFTVNVDSTAMPECFLFKKLPKKCKLIAATIAHPKNLMAWPNQSEIYFYNLKAESKLTNDITLLYSTLDMLESRLNVGEFCVNLATKYFNYGLVVTVGLDFAYVDNKNYADGTVHEVSQEESYGLDNYIMLDCFGKPVNTNASFIGFLIAFMANYKNVYTKKSTLISLNKGILPLKYDFDKLLEFMKKVDSLAAKA